MWEEFGRSTLATRVHVHVAKFSCNATTVSYKRLYIVSNRWFLCIYMAYITCFLKISRSKLKKLDIK